MISSRGTMKGFARVQGNPQLNSYSYAKPNFHEEADVAVG